MTRLLSRYFILASALALTACEGRELNLVEGPQIEENIAAQVEQTHETHEALQARVEASLNEAAALIDESAAEAGEAVEEIITP